MGLHVFIYKILSSIVFKTLPILGRWNPKLKKGINGRKETLSKIISFRNDFPNEDLIWFHCASLGEFEQAVPLINKYKNTSPDIKIAVSFYSPSGYEPNQDNTLLDLVFYLPFDNSKEFKKITTTLKPSKVIVVKYEFWYFFLKSIVSNKIPLYLISAYFLPHQVFFKKWGGFHRTMLSFFDHIFVQDESSLKLLESIQINQVSISGDTRIDRAVLTKKEMKPIPYIENWLPGNSQVIVAGSTWKEDIDLLSKAYCQLPGFYWIIAPHNIDEVSLNTTLKSFPQDKVVLWSERALKQDNEKRVLVIDTMGMLKQIYQYANIVWIGGGFNRSGIHNLIEAAVFENSIYIGPNYERFKEAKDLIALNGVKSVSGVDEFTALIKDVEGQVLSQQVIQNYVGKQAGATQLIWDFIENRQLKN